MTHEELLEEVETSVWLAKTKLRQALMDEARKLQYVETIDELRRVLQEPDAKAIDAHREELSKMMFCLETVVCLAEEAEGGGE